MPPSWPVKICARQPSCSSVTFRGRRRRLAVAVVDRLGPVDDRERGDAGEVDVAAVALGDVVADRGLAAAVRRRREAGEVAGAAGLAVAELIALALQSPGGGGLRSRWTWHVSSLGEVGEDRWVRRLGRRRARRWRRRRRGRSSPRPCREFFSMTIRAVRTAIHRRFIVPRATSTANSAQQQPRQKAPCATPIRSAPAGRRTTRPPKRRKNPIGERQWRRQTDFSGVTCHSAAASSVAPAIRPAQARPSASGISSSRHAR